MIIYGSYNITVYSYSHEDNLDYNIVRQVGYFTRSVMAKSIEFQCNIIIIERACGYCYIL